MIVYFMLVPFGEIGRQLSCAGHRPRAAGARHRRLRRAVHAGRRLAEAAAGGRSGLYVFGWEQFAMLMPGYLRRFTPRLLPAGAGAARHAGRRGRVVAPAVGVHRDPVTALSLFVLLVGDRRVAGPGDADHRAPGVCPWSNKPCGRRGPFRCSLEATAVDGDQLRNAAAPRPRIMSRWSPTDDETYPAVSVPRGHHSGGWPRNRPGRLIRRAPEPGNHRQQRSGRAGLRAPPTPPSSPLPTFATSWTPSFARSCSSCPQTPIQGADQFEAETGINIQTDVDRIVASMSGTPDPSNPARACVRCSWPAAGSIRPGSRQPSGPKAARSRSTTSSG